MKYRLIGLHSLVLTAINIGAIVIGSWGNAWLHRLNPVAAQFPVAVLVCIMGFGVWYQLIQAISSEKLLLQGIREWSQVYGITLVWGPVMFVPFHYVVRGHVLSLGSVIALWCFQGLVNILVLMATSLAHSRDRIQQLLRRRWFSRMFAVCLGCLLSAILLCLLEGVFYILNTYRSPAPKRQFEGGYLRGEYFQDDALLGYKPKPLSHVSSTLKIDGKIVYDVTYSIDQYSRRVTPVRNRDARTDFALFFGCSFTIGEGVNDDETLPSYFAADAPNYMPYNYGFHGYGPQEMLAKFQSHTLKAEIHEKRGIPIYTYLEEAHEARAIGDMAVSNGWGAYMPYYKVDSTGHPRRNGNFTSGRPWLSFAYHLLGRSQMIRYFQMNFPARLTAQHYQLTAKMIEAARDLFKTQFQSEAFYVLFYPKNAPQKKILPYLEQAGIRYLDYSTLFDPAADGYAIPGDGHPSPQAYRTIAEHLAKDIGAFQNR